MDKRKILVLCTGTFLVGKKKHTGLKELNKLDINDRLFSYNRSLVAGGIHEIEAVFEDDKLSSYYPHSVLFKYKLDDDVELAKIMLRHESCETIISALNQAKKAKADKSAILETLKPIRQAYQNTNHAGRLALEVRVLNYLRNGNDLH